ncbi:hypothetical protein JOD24_000800 [Kroppenstedtia sanguinis]|uniref:Uncharacterized protein n=1 Tax=Kroppenstedtia sanguinis TaxID=1380684 RepID=A0ABW4C9K3_9BACL
MLSVKKIPPLLDVTLDETNDIPTEDDAGYRLYCNYMRVPPGYTYALSVQLEEEAPLTSKKSHRWESAAFILFHS